MKSVVIDKALTYRDVAKVASGNQLNLSAAALQRITEARVLVDAIVTARVRAYGVNTGVGALCDTVVDAQQLQALSRNIVMSHACGVGEPLSTAQTRAIMACAINNFAHGASGIRPLVVERLLLLLNSNLVPRVPRDGSLGYITMMAHISLVLLGEGQAHSADRMISGREALQLLGVPPLVLEAKEGLSLVNGTPDSTGLACVALEHASRLLDWADVIAAMTFENIGQNLSAFAPESLRFNASEPVRRTGARLVRLLADSRIISRTPTRTQDAMSLRALPQVHGAVRECFESTSAVVDRELASATDNPLVAGTAAAPTIHSGAHAVATGLALSLDALCIAIAKIAAMSERRIDRLVNPLVNGLAAFLAGEPGVTSGLMIAQYTALALASENRRLAAPSSLDGGVSSGLQEDEIPHATTGALRLLKLVENFHTMLTIELLAAAQAYEFQDPALARAAAGDAVYRSLRKRVAPYRDAAPLAADIAAAAALLASETPPH